MEVNGNGTCRVDVRVSGVDVDGLRDGPLRDVCDAVVASPAKLNDAVRGNRAPSKHAFRPSRQLNYAHEHTHITKVLIVH